MSVARPPLPPRRSVPPPPRRVASVSSKVGVDEIPTGIAARIAGLQLEQVARVKAPLAKPPPPPRFRKEPAQEPEPEAPLGETEQVDEPINSHGPPPPVPPRWTRPSPAELARALARRPPPPPSKSPAPQRSDPSPPPSPRGTGAPRRRLPPMPTRLPTPPPEPVADFEDAGYDMSVPYDDQNACLQCRDFSHVDAHAALFPRHTVTSLDNLAYDLTEPFPYETEKARAIFTWLHLNIAYDTVSFFSGNLRPATAESTLQSGLAVCDGYAGLFMSLAGRVGLQAHRVAGHGKGVGYVATEPGQPVPKYSSGHAWNCVFMDGEWHLIDSCWGSGALQGMSYEQRFAPMWFTSSSAEFGKRHYPEDPSYQFLSDEQGGPVTWEDYIMEPEGPTIFVDFFNLDLWPSVIQPSTKYIEGGRRISFHIFKRCEHMSTAEADNFVYIISTADNTRTPLALNAEGGWSADIYIPKGGEVSLYSVTTVDGKDAKGIGMEAFKRAVGRKPMTFGGLARWTVI